MRSARGSPPQLGDRSHNIFILGNRAASSGRETPLRSRLLATPAARLRSEHDGGAVEGHARDRRGVGLSTGDSWTSPAADAASPGSTVRGRFMAHDAYVSLRPQRDDLRRRGSLMD